MLKSMKLQAKSKNNSALKTTSEQHNSKLNRHTHSNNSRAEFD